MKKKQVYRGKLLALRERFLLNWSFLTSINSKIYFVETSSKSAEKLNYTTECINETFVQLSLGGFLISISTEKKFIAINYY